MPLTAQSGATGGHTRAPELRLKALISPTRKLTPNKRLPFCLGFFVLFLSKRTVVLYVGPAGEPRGQRPRCRPELPELPGLLPLRADLPRSATVALQSIFLLGYHTPVRGKGKPRNFLIRHKEMRIDSCSIASVDVGTDGALYT